MALLRITKDRDLVAGPHSVRTAAFRIVLREIDWALKTGFTKFSSRSSRGRAYRDLAEPKLAWKLESKKYHGPEVDFHLIPYDEKNVANIGTAIVSRSNGMSGLHATADRLHREGSSALSAVWLESIGYDREEEVRTPQCSNPFATNFGR